jgi:uncharacterized protein (TIGR01777 family)
MVRILVSGASGFIGAPLTSFLSSNGHSVVSLPRDFSIDSFEGFDAVIHLAGEPLTIGRWSKEKEHKILASRVDGTTSLCNLLASTNALPKVFISASAVGYYGDRGEELLTEESGVGGGFLSKVCSLWEGASLPLSMKGTRVVHTRFGMVLGPGGGALSKMVPPYRFGLGGALGSGRQWVSWVHLEDLIAALNHVLTCESLEGAVNVVSPNPVRQEEFSATLAELLHRPHFLKVPASLLKVAFGKMAEELLLASARVYPAKLLASNFSFKYDSLRSALLQIIF